MAEANDIVELAASLAGLPALQSLKLEAYLVQRPCWLRACLPPSLTRLSLDMHVEFLDGQEQGERWLAEVRPASTFPSLHSVEPAAASASPARAPPPACLSPSRRVLPLQVASLTQLRQLSLAYASCDSATYAPLACLSGCLTGLELRSCAELPACLPELSSLQSLSLLATPLEDDEDEGWWRGRALNPALKGLAASLTSLVIEDAPEAGAFPAALTALQHLHHLAWQPSPPADPRLPVGRWLRQLQSLLLPALAVVYSRPQLAFLTRLQALQLHAWHPRGHRHLAILPWAAQHGSLSELYLDCSRGELKRDVVAAVVARCGEQNPGLLVSPGARLSRPFDGHK